MTDEWKTGGQSISVKGYVLVFWSVDKRQHHAWLHRLVWEEHFGEIPPTYVIHHIDGNKQNNDIGNLQCMPLSLHSKLHNSEQNELTIAKRISAVTQARIRRLDKNVNDFIPQIHVLLRDGLTLTAIANELGFSRQYVTQMIQRAHYKVVEYSLLIPDKEHEPIDWMPYEHKLEIESLESQRAIYAQKVKDHLAITAQLQKEIDLLQNQLVLISGQVPLKGFKSKHRDGTQKMCIVCHSAAAKTKNMCTKCYGRTAYQRTVAKRHALSATG